MASSVPQSGQVMLGQADDLGGGMFKKRLSKNQYRSLILAVAGSIGRMRICLEAGPGQHQRG